MEIRRSYDRLISTMGFPILVWRHLYIESGPWSLWGEIHHWIMSFLHKGPIMGKVLPVMVSSCVHINFYLPIRCSTDFILWSLLYPRFNEVERGVYWFHLVRLSVCGQNRVCSVFSTILVGSISYLHTSSCNLRKCVMCNVCFKILKIEILANSLNL